ncbi:hypothetical protein [Gilvimarinus chinensis]|uniref:hypothetical protein n=1 Tax=Gilvimarinus chinensis TaxID=396005 RepID=UPI0003823100|nr:hypothetical protein [Gilvimarinus chinensis]
MKFTDNEKRILSLMEEGKEYTELALSTNRRSMMGLLKKKAVTRRLAQADIHIPNSGYKYRKVIA